MMTEVQPVRVSKATIRRLPVYHGLLTGMLQTGRDVVSCRHIAEELRLDQTQVRKDLAATGIVGRPRTGYSLPLLLQSIESFLGWNNSTDAVLVGVGHLGTALLGFREGFAQRGVNIVAAFDENPAKIGTTVHEVDVLDVDRLPDLVMRLNVHIGIVTVPVQAAQGIADLMVLSGITAIWNLAPTFLEVPESIIVEDTQLSASLAVLSSRLAEHYERA